jgi:hypothetical protein
MIRPSIPPFGSKTKERYLRQASISRYTLPSKTYFDCPTPTHPSSPSQTYQLKLFRELNSAIGCFDAAVKMSQSRKKAKELDAEEDTTVGF